MKQPKLALAMEAATLAYMALMVWFLFPGWRGPIAKAWRGGFYRWRLGRDQIRFAPLAGWIQEAAQVRGRYLPPERAPRPLNLPL